MKAITTGKVIPSHPFAFHVRYYWDEKIDYQILNSETVTLVDEAEQVSGLPQKTNLRGRVHVLLSTVTRKLF